MKLKLFLLFFVFVQIKSVSQIVYESVDSEINTHLDYFANKGLTNYNSNITPLSRQSIAKILDGISKRVNNLNTIEKDILLYFQKDYALELEFINKKYDKHISLLSVDPLGRFRAFSYSDSLFKLNLEPILGYEIGNYKNNFHSHRWNGIKFYGYIGNNIGFKFYFRDNREGGKYFPVLDTNFNSNTKVILSKYDKNFIEYSDLRASINYSWNWGNITFGKDVLEWGYGNSGKVVLSRNSPSYPFIRLDVYPVNWLSFNYFHGWLKSDLVDSSRSIGSKEIFRDKFIASHSITIKPFDKLEFSIGESIIYSEKLEIAYLNPLLFFRLADHYLANATNKSGGNAQFFFSFDFRNVLSNSRFYGNFYLDDITLSKIFNKDNRVFKNGFSIGYQKAGFFSLLTLLGVEYTRIAPFVYEHNMLDQHYKSAGDVLGHWIGHNADLLELYIKYYPIWNLQISFNAHYLRQGEKNDLTNIQNSDQPDFLFGLKKKQLKYGLEIKYTFMHDLVARTKVNFFEYFEEDINHNFNQEKYNEFSFALYYGL